MKSETLKRPGDSEIVAHSSRRVHCSARDQAAVISVISRAGPHGPIRFVLWCSLRAAGECAEGCLACAGRPPGPTERAATVAPAE